jgi:hypothetical protein
MKNFGYVRKGLLATLLVAVAMTTATGCFPKKQQPVQQVAAPVPVVQAEKVEEIASYPINNVSEIVSTANVETDAGVSNDGAGSVKVSVVEPTTINLFEESNIDAGQSKLVYQAKLKSQNLEGNAYLEMLLHFPDTGDFYVQGNKTEIAGTTDWKTIEASTELEKGRNPDSAKLRLIVGGKGTVWVDDVKLLKVVKMINASPAAANTTTEQAETSSLQENLHHP